MTNDDAHRIIFEAMPPGATYETEMTGGYITVTVFNVAKQDMVNVDRGLDAARARLPSTVRVKLMHPH